MVFAKSVLAGLLCLIAVEMLLLLTLGVIAMPPPGTQVGIDIDSLPRVTPPFWILAVLAFSLGFHWEYRRLKILQAK
jgi:hypothetical protein